MEPDSVDTVDVLVAVLAPIEDRAALLEKLLMVSVSAAVTRAAAVMGH
jgi:hypothetical protein